MTPTLRIATPADAEALAEFKHDTFREAFLGDFAVPYPPADLAVFVAQSYTLEVVRRELEDAARRTWVAEAGG